MKCRMLILALLCVIEWQNGLQARPVGDTLFVYFRRGYSVLDLSFRDNRQTLDAFVGQLKALRADTARYAVTLFVEGNASPDGTVDANVRLTENRVKNVLAHIRRQAAFPDTLIRIRAEGIDWDGLAERVASDHSVPGRDKALEILHRTPVWVFDAQGRIVDSRKKQLMDLEGGSTYRYLSEHYFPGLRNTMLQLIYAVASDAPPTAETDEPRDSVQASEQDMVQEQRMEPSAEPKPEEVPVRADSMPREKTQGAVISDSGEDRPADREPLYRLALKTNLLYDAILMPSLEIEYRINDRWSVNLEGEVAWWSRKPRHKYYQIATISPEGRYWFKTKKPWHGHYVGVFVGGSWYDLENGGRGYKGEFYMTGLSYGYMFPIGRVLSLEAGIGIGFLHTSYKEYLPLDGHYVYQQTSRTNYFGPVKLKLALAWRLWDLNRKGGER